MYVEETLFDVVPDQVVVIRQEFEKLSDSSITLYRLGVVLNVVLEKLNVKKSGSDYRVRTQMMYNYNRNKMIVKGQIVKDVTKDQAIEFAIRFVQRVSK